MQREIQNSEAKKPGTEIHGFGFRTNSACFALNFTPSRLGRVILDSSTFPIHDPAALVAGWQLGERVRSAPARGGFDLAGNFQVAAAAFAAVDRHDGGHVAAGDSIIDSQAR